MKLLMEVTNFMSAHENAHESYKFHEQAHEQILLSHEQVMLMSYAGYYVVSWASHKQISPMSKRYTLESN